MGHNEGDITEAELPILQGVETIIAGLCSSVEHRNPECGLNVRARENALEMSETFGVALVNDPFDLI